MKDPRRASREKFIKSLEKCVTLQNPTIPAPDVPRVDDWIPGSTECIPEEPMGNGQPSVDCEAQSVADIARPETETTETRYYDGSWA